MPDPTLPTGRRLRHHGGMADWCVYILRCRDGSLYTGVTNDLGRRLAAHAAGTGARYTASRRPIALVYREPQADRAAALRREAAIRRLGRQGKLALVSASPEPPVGDP